MSHAFEINWSARRTGDIGLVWGNDPLSHAIEALEDYAGEGPHPPSHSFVVADYDYVLEAIWPKVSMTPASSYEGKAVKLFRLENVPLYKLAIALEQVRAKYLGTRYNLSGIVGFLFVEMARHIHHSLANWLASKRMVWCSQLCSEFIDLTITKALNGEYTDPAGLLAWLTR